MITPTFILVQSWGREKAWVPTPARTSGMRCGLLAYGCWEGEAEAEIWGKMHISDDLLDDAMNKGWGKYGTTEYDD